MRDTAQVDTLNSVTQQMDEPDYLGRTIDRERGASYRPRHDGYRHDGVGD